jgi:hypothetical protein
MFNRFNRYINTITNPWVRAFLRAVYYLARGISALIRNVAVLILKAAGGFFGKLFRGKVTVVLAKVAAFLILLGGFFAWLGLESVGGPLILMSFFPIFGIGISMMFRNVLR